MTVDTGTKRPVALLRLGLEAMGIVFIGLILGVLVAHNGGAAFAAMTSLLPPRTWLLVMHVIGVTLGFGSALFLDFLLKPYLYDRDLDPRTVATAEFGSRLVALGLALLWLSGIGFLALYAAEAPEKLANPKIHAKVAVVLMLTVNGLLIHWCVLPRIAARIGHRVIGNWRLRQTLPFLLAGIVSSVSWAFAFGLGMIRELNNIAPAPLLLAAYGGALLLATAGACGYHLWRSADSRLKDATRGFTPVRPTA